MRMLWMTVALVACCSVMHAQSPATSAVRPVSERDRFVGAWRLAPGASGPRGVAGGVPPTGTLIYTSDGRMAVQIMYGPSATAPSNRFVQNGYEAHFGTYEIDEATHTVIHHVEASVTRDLLIGQDVRFNYRFTPEGRLVLGLTWERY